MTARADQLDLAGTWSFQLDRQDQGEADKWFERDLPDRIALPGVLTAQGYGDPPSMQTQWTGNINPIWQSDPYYKQYQTPDNFKMPFWLQPDRHYVGAAWYQRQIEVPPNGRANASCSSWSGRTGRPPSGSMAGRSARRTASAPPTCYDLGTNVAPGKHRLTIRVDNRMIVDVGNNAHSVSDHTQGNWNGIAGRIELRATDPVWIDDVRLYPNIKDKTVGVKVSIGNLTGQAGSGTLTIRVPGGGQADVGPGLVGTGRRPGEMHLRDGQATANCGMSSIRRLYDMTVELQGDASGRQYQDRQRSPLRHAGGGHAGDADRHQRQADVPPGHARMLHLPADGPPADRRGLVEADHPHLQGPRPEPYPLPLLVPARGGVRRGR